MSTNKSNICLRTLQSLERNKKIRTSLSIFWLKGFYLFQRNGEQTSVITNSFEIFEVWNQYSYALNIASNLFYKTWLLDSLNIQNRYLIMISYEGNLETSLSSFYLSEHLGGPQKSHKVNRRNLRLVVFHCAAGSDDIYWFKTGTKLKNPLTSVRQSSN